MGKVTESIYSDDSVVVPMADVQHIQKRKDWLFVITKHTKYNTEIDDWENPIYIPATSKENFLRAWCTYRHELEVSTLKDMQPDVEECPFVSFAGDLCPKNRNL